MLFKISIFFAITRCLLRRPSSHFNVASLRERFLHGTEPELLGEGHKALEMGGSALSAFAPENQIRDPWVSSKGPYKVEVVGRGIVGRKDPVLSPRSLCAILPGSVHSQTCKHNYAQGQQRDGFPKV